MSESNLKSSSVESNILNDIAFNNENAFKDLYNLYKDRIYNLALSILNSKEDSEDVLVEVFITLFNNKEKLFEVENFSAYVYTITKHKSINLYKKKQLQYQKIKSLKNDDLINYTTNSVEIAVYFKETQEIIQSNLKKLPQQQKTVFELIKLQGLKRKEVAELLNISENTVRNHLNVVLKIVKSEFQKNYSFFLPILFWLIQK